MPPAVMNAARPPARVLVADPPWPSTPARLPLAEGGRLLPYKRMSEEEISASELPPLDDYCVLFLWRLASMQEMALRVCRAWGFRPYGEMIWVKRTTKDKLWCGMGLLLRSSHETCLVGVRAKPKGRMPVPHGKNTRSVIEAKYTGRHSGKPEAFFNEIEHMLDGPYYELFARQQRPGWICSGDELHV